MIALSLLLDRWLFLKWMGCGLLALGISVAASVLGTDPDALPRRWWARYVAHLERRLHELFRRPRGSAIASAQLAGIVLSIGAGVAGAPGWYAGVAASALGPLWHLAKLKRERMAKLDAQVEPFATALANALKTTPSIGNALAVLGPIVEAPMQEELNLVLKELRVGSTLEQSLHDMATRAGSVELEAALSAILVGRQVGGNLPEILDTTARSLRESARLGGVVRTKTASGRTQLVVLSLAPLVVLVGFEIMKPGYFQPLGESGTGWALSMIIAGLWIFGIVLARKVMQVDI